MNDESWGSRVAGDRSRLSRRQMLIGGSFLVAATAGLVLKPRRAQNMLGSAKLEDLVPKQFGGWRFNTASGLVLPPADQLRDQIYSQLLTRVYVRDDRPPLMMLIAYSGSQDGTLQVHRPEVCYPASGYRLTQNEPHTVTLAPGIALPSRDILAETDVRRERLIYWTRQGSHFPTRWSEQRTAVIAENFAGIIPDGVLVRLSTSGDGATTPVLDEFARDLYGAVGPRMRRVLLGPTLGGPAAG
ncbi:exosortase-associated protein EpsI, V-type [uncultured Sphingomonas sp.]|uniref:exosortase-associated protein EpsI, V-type n=1 Tax=uncultured Sphingomonas sp. TaxID=158754 RepID=UPI0035CC89C4